MFGKNIAFFSCTMNHPIFGVPSGRTPHDGCSTLQLLFFSSKLRTCEGWFENIALSLGEVAALKCHWLHCNHDEKRLKQYVYIYMTLQLMLVDNCSIVKWVICTTKHHGDYRKPRWKSLSLSFSP